MADTKSRHMPASYPAASLGLCLKKAAMALEALPALGAAPRLWATQDDFAQACGYKGFDANSAPKGLIAAMSHFGLIERDSHKRLRMRPELISALVSDEARAELISKAVKRPKIHQALFAMFGTQASPSRQEVSKHLCDVCGFASRPGQIMASNFIEDLALLRSVASAPASADFVESISTPGGAHVRLASDRELTGADLAFIEKYLRLKRESSAGASSVDAA